MAENLLEIHLSIHHNGKTHLEHVLKDQPIDFLIKLPGIVPLLCIYLWKAQTNWLWISIVGSHRWDVHGHCFDSFCTTLLFVLSYHFSRKQGFRGKTLSEVFKMENTLLILFLYFTEIPQCNDVSFTRILRS